MSIESDLQAVVELVRTRMPQLATAIVKVTSEEVPELHRRDDPAFREAERPSVVSALTGIVDGLAGGRRPPEGANDSALHEARVAAQAGIDLHALLQTYRIGQSLLWDVILEGTMRVIDSDERRIAVLKQASDYQYAWNNKVTEAVVAAYQAEHQAYFFRSQDRKRRAVIGDILRGLPTDVEQLGYGLQTDHMAVIAWGRSAEANIRALAVALGARHLAVSGTGGTHLGWLGAKAMVRVMAERPEAIQAMPETYLALGEVESGLEGFRLSHRQAWQAYRVSRLRREAIVRYREVALESVMLNDRQAVRDFAARELGALDQEDPRDDLLLSTLRAYFRLGLNAASTAQEIHVHERTVAYRLRSIESRLGVTINARRDELAVALRLADLLQHADEHDVRCGRSEEGLAFDSDTSPH